MKYKKISTILIIMFLTACASAKVDITKTGKGYFEPTKADNVQILKTIPDEEYEELGTITVSGFGRGDAAKMHNAIRAQSATIGADAVVLTNEGLVPNGWGGFKRWASGVAIHFNESN